MTTLLTQFWIDCLPWRLSYFNNFYEIFLESSLLTLLHMDVRATCFLYAHSHQRTEDWNYDNSQERVHCYGCCLWVGMDLRAFWSMEEEFEVEILFRVGRQVRSGLGKVIFDMRTKVDLLGAHCGGITDPAAQRP